MSDPVWRWLALEGAKVDPVVAGGVRAGMLAGSAGAPFPRYLILGDGSCVANPERLGFRAGLQVAQVCGLSTIILAAVQRLGVSGESDVFVGSTRS